MVCFLIPLLLDVWAVSAYLRPRVVLPWTSWSVFMLEFRLRLLPGVHVGVEF